MKRLAYFVYHEMHPGNPWGPFAMRELAEAHMGDLLKTFSGPYYIKAEYTPTD